MLYAFMEFNEVKNIFVSLFLKSLLSCILPDWTLYSILNTDRNIEVYVIKSLKISTDCAIFTCMLCYVLKALNSGI